MNITYEHVMPVPTIIMAIMAVIAVGGVSYWLWVDKNIKTIIICVIRVLFLLGLGWCMLMPELIQSDKVTLKPRFIIAVDASGSMKLRPSESVPHRWANMKECFDMDWINFISEECEVDIWPFTTEVGGKLSVEEVKAAEPEGQATLLRDSLKKIAGRYAGQNVAGFVLLSDGIDTREAYDDWSLQPWPFPIYTVRLEEDGLWEEDPDVHIDAVNTPRRVTVDWDTTLKVALSGQGTKGQDQVCQLYKNGELYSEQPFQIPAGGGAREVAFSLLNPDIGAYNYKVVVPPVEGEKNKDDNVYEVDVIVIDAKNRLLYVDGHPRWESRFLKRMLMSNKQATPLGFIMGPNGKFMTFGTRGSMTADMREDQLVFFKIVVLGNLDAKELTEARATNLIKFVEDGGSLVCLGGLKGWGENGLMDTKLKKILPVKSVGRQIKEGEFKVDVTAEGRSHPAFAGDPEFWNVVPAILSVFPNARMAPGAEAMVSCTTPEGLQPLIVSHRYGQGKVVAVLTDSLWKWKLSEDSIEHKPYDRFWVQMLQWLTPAKDQANVAPLEIFADREQLFLGEDLELSARKGGREGDDAFEAANVQVMIIGPDKRALPYNTTKKEIPSDTGRTMSSYVFEYKAETPGIHKAFATMKIGAKKYDSDPVSFFVKPFTPETIPKPANVQVLQGIATSSKGEYFETTAELSDAMQELSFATLEREQKEYVSLWNNWWVLGALVFVVTAGWVVRKLQNMP